MIKSLPQKLQDALIIVALFLLIFVSFSEFMIVAPILKNIGEHLNIPEELRSLLLTTYALAAGFFSFLAGPFSDKYGRRAILLYGSFFFSIATFLNGMAFNFTSILLFRALTGLAAGILSGAAVAYIGDYFPYHQRGTVTGITFMGNFAGQILGVPIGIYLTGLHNFRIPFFLFGVLTLMVFLLVKFVVPTPNVTLSREPITLSNYISKYRNLLKIKNVVFASLTYLFIFLAFSIMISYMPTWFMTRFQVTESAIASLYLAGGVGAILGSPIAGYVSDRFGRKPLIVLANIVLTVLTAWTTWYSSIFRDYYPFYFVIMVCVSCRFSPFHAMVTAFVGAKDRGSLLGLIGTVGQMGLGIGSAFAGFIYKFWGFQFNALFAAFFTLFVTIFVAFFIEERKEVKPLS
jgi:predicted MFS family arabinose efflux permease